jgi:hypothetical protein
MTREFGSPATEVEMRKTSWLWLCVGVAFAPGLLAAASGPPRGQEAAPAADERLTRILERTQAYCAKLEKASLDFTCLEKIDEKTYPSPEIQPDTPIVAGGGISYSYPSRRSPYVNSYVYDYQFVRKGDKKTERRILIEENGQKKKEEDAALVTLTVRVENALFGPIGLLGAQWQAYHDYKIVGEETRKGKKVLVIEAAPKPKLKRPHCYGRIWVQEDDASILKIVWEPTSIGNFGEIEARARGLGAEPRLTSVTEYGLLKNGVRFPSKDTTEEGYELKNGKTSVRSLTTIVYKDYKFFTVETEVIY